MEKSKMKNYILIFSIILSTIFYSACSENELENLSYIEGGSIKYSLTQKDTIVNDYFIGKREISCKQYIDFLNDIRCKEDFTYNGNILITDTTLCPISVISSIQYNNDSFHFRVNRVINDINCPITNITLHGALEFCNWKSREFDLKECYTITNDSIYYNSKANGYRLPTEVEWEYAAKAGTNNKWSGIDNENLVDDYIWYYKNSGDKYLDENIMKENKGIELINKIFENKCRLHKVGSKEPNSLEIYNMNGNASELCWGETLIPNKKYPKQILTIFRGGNYRYHQLLCKISYRNRFFSILGTADVGFRISRNI